MQWVLYGYEKGDIADVFVCVCHTRVGGSEELPL